MGGGPLFLRTLCYNQSACIKETKAVPIYEYQCKSCGEKFEKLQRTMSDTAKVECPKCKSDQTARELSVFAVGAEGAAKSSASAGPMCGRCGGPGPCAMG